MRMCQVLCGRFIFTEKRCRLKVGIYEIVNAVYFALVVMIVY
ncbi:hypothetical protein [Anoxybacillus sp. KU2-6(11)]|nr:hypothetical protein [Anoxybacillus sp. KU2-6(11)]